MISSPNSCSGAFVPNSKVELKAAINNCVNNWNNTGKGGGSDATGGAVTIDDPEKGLHLMLHKDWLKDSSGAWWETFVRNVRWYRVKYKSNRFGKECETPCWTTFYGGRESIEPYTPVPAWLQPLVDRVSAHKALGAKFNAMLVRLYFDGSDEIAWHTDGRTFLGKTPTIASLSLGATVKFQLRRMTNVWPCGGDDGVDRTTPQREVLLGDGDLFAMLGPTQEHWHHRVPKTKGRRPRININFRYILPGPDADRGQKTYYKYMVHGDAKHPRSFTFHEIMKRSGSMLNYFTNSQDSLSKKSPAPSPPLLLSLSPKPSSSPKTSLPSAVDTTTDPDKDAVSPPHDQHHDQHHDQPADRPEGPPSRQWWQCPACTFMHEGESKISYLACEVCGTIRTNVDSTCEPPPKRCRVRRESASSLGGKRQTTLLSMFATGHNTKE